MCRAQRLSVSLKRFRLWRKGAVRRVRVTVKYESAQLWVNLRLLTRPPVASLVFEIEGEALKAFASMPPARLSLLRSWPMSDPAFDPAQAIERATLEAVEMLNAARPGRLAFPRLWKAGDACRSRRKALTSRLQGSEWQK